MVGHGRPYMIRECVLTTTRTKTLCKIHPIYLAHPLKKEGMEFRDPPWWMNREWGWMGIKSYSLIQMWMNGDEQYQMLMNGDEQYPRPIRSAPFICIYSYLSAFVRSVNLIKSRLTASALFIYNDCSFLQLAKLIPNIEIWPWPLTLTPWSWPWP